MVSVEKMKRIAIITARGGSKRIPRKNIREFCGKPIIAYSIDAALSSGMFDEVMVSMDDPRIGEISLSYGAKVPFYRSAKNSDDHSTTADVLLEVLCEYLKEGREFDMLACIYPTAPFVTSGKLTEAVGVFESIDCDGLMSVVKYDFPPQRSMIIENDRLKWQYPQHRNTRSQDLVPVYHDCGQFYLCNVSKFLECKTLIFDNEYPYVVSDLEVQDIDNESDWKIAEMKYRIMDMERG